MAQPTFKGEKAFITAVAKNKMMEETVKKEMKHLKLVDEFVINPFRKSKSCDLYLELHIDLTLLQQYGIRILCVV